MASGNQISDALTYFIDLYIAWLTLLNAHGLHTPSGGVLGSVFDRHPVGGMLTCIPFQFPTLVIQNFGVMAIAMRALWSILLLALGVAYIIVGFTSIWHFCK